MREYWVSEQNRLSERDGDWGGAKQVLRMLVSRKTGSNMTKKHREWVNNPKEGWVVVRGRKRERWWECEYRIKVSEWTYKTDKKRSRASNWVKKIFEWVIMLVD